MTKHGNPPASIAESGTAYRVFDLNRPMGSFDAGSISHADAKWAVTVDAIAGVAVEASQRGDPRRAITYYGKALRLAPGCDLYLMSIGCCYANLGNATVGLRYLERAAEISPGRMRIRDNLASVRLAARRAG